MQCNLKIYHLVQYKKPIAKKRNVVVLPFTFMIGFVLCANITNAGDLGYIEFLTCQKP